MNYVLPRTVQIALFLFPDAVRLALYDSRRGVWFTSPRWFRPRA